MTDYTSIGSRARAVTTSDSLDANAALSLYAKKFFEKTVKKVLLLPRVYLYPADSD